MPKSLIRKRLREVIGVVRMSPIYFMLSRLERRHCVRQAFIALVGNDYYDLIGEVWREA